MSVRKGGILSTLSDQQSSRIPDHQQSLQQLEKVAKSKIDLKKRFYQRKQQQLIFDNLSFGFASKFEAACQLLEDDLKDRVKTLGLWNCNITNPKMSEMLTTLYGSQSLQYLELSDLVNVMKKQTVKNIAQIFQTLPKRQKKQGLLIQRSFISIKTANTLLKLLALTKIRSLVMSEMEIGCDHIKPIFDLLSNNQEIKSLHLNNNDIKMGGALHIGQGLVQNHSLKILNLNNNQLGSKGVQLICESLFDNKSLVSLFLSNNGLDSDAIPSISQLLKSQKSSLQELHLSNNRISQEGLKLLFDTLAFYNKKLRYLDVAYNVIEIGILHSFRTMLEKNHSLNYLSISGLYKFNENAQNGICDSLILNTGLKLIDFKKCTRLFFFSMSQGVNMYKGNNKIVFLKENKFITPREQFRSLTPQKAPSTKQLSAKKMVKRQFKRSKKHRVELQSNERLNIRTDDFQPKRSQSLDNTYLNSSEPSNYTFQNQTNEQESFIDTQTSQQYTPLRRSPEKVSREKEEEKIEMVVKKKKRTPKKQSSQGLNMLIREEGSVEEEMKSPGDQNKRVQFANDIKIFKEKKPKKSPGKHLKQPKVKSSLQKMNISNTSLGTSVDSKVHNSQSIQNRKSSVTSGGSARKGILKQDSGKKIKNTSMASPSQGTSLYHSIDSQKYNTKSINETSIMSGINDTTSFALTPEEKENMKYNMKNDKVVVFYKKILGDIREVIREERNNIKKYLQ